MLNKEVLDLIKAQGEGLILTKRDYKVVLDQAKKQAEAENRKYDYSKIYSMVYDGKKGVKLTYIDVPTVNPNEEFDHSKDYTSFNYAFVTLDEIAKLKFVD